MSGILATPSFRDPDGYVVAARDRVLRCVYPHAAPDVRAFLESGFARDCMMRGTLVRSSVVKEDSFPPGALALEHQPVSFTAYPYEWPPEMLYAAAELTLRLAQESAPCGFRLKDASPYNVLFEGARPVFVDVLSFHRGEPRQGIWHAYAQFVQAFVYPLLAVKFCGLRLDELLLVHRDGLEPDRLMRMLPRWRLAIPPALVAVTVPALLSAKPRSTARPPLARDEGEAAFLVSKAIARAGRLLESARPTAKLADQRAYGESGHPYTESELLRKQDFVVRAIEHLRPAAVLDIGCNTGRFSKAAAKRGCFVTALDAEPDFVGRLWREASERALPILPLVVDIARPPGASGWNNCEHAAFLDRARERFDCVMMLALIHHLLVTERIPLDSILSLAAELTTVAAIVEWVDPADRQFQIIAAGRQELFRKLNLAGFESALARHFSVAVREQVTPTRALFLLRKSAGP